MDLILQRFADRHLDTMDEGGLGLYDAMLSENDHDIYQWVTGQAAPPDHYGSLIDAIIDDLPLFSAVATSTPQPAKPSELDRMITDIHPDELTPKEALDLIYKLKEAASS